MTFYEWCQQNNLTVAEAERRALKNDEKFMKAYENFKRLAFEGVGYGRSNDNGNLCDTDTVTSDSTKS